MSQIIRHNTVVMTSLYPVQGALTGFFFGSFGLSTKEHYTIMLCPSSSFVVASSSVDTSPSHRFKDTNFIFGTNMHLCPHICTSNISRFRLVLFKWQQFWYFSLICYHVHKDSYRDFIWHVHMYLFFTYIY